MDGIHDLGGMHGFGPVVPEVDEPVFHDPWEGRLFAMRVSFPGLFGRPGGARYAIERLDPAFQLTASYYERWLASFVAGLLARGAFTVDELADRERHYAAEPAAPVPRHDDPDQATLALRPPPAAPATRPPRARHRPAVPARRTGARGERASGRTHAPPALRPGPAGRGDLLPRRP